MSDLRFTTLTRVTDSASTDEPVGIRAGLHTVVLDLLDPGIEWPAVRPRPGRPAYPSMDVGEWRLTSYGDARITARRDFESLLHPHHLSLVACEELLAASAERWPSIRSDDVRLRQADIAVDLLFARREAGVSALAALSQLELPKLQTSAFSKDGRLRGVDYRRPRSARIQARAYDWAAGHPRRAPKGPPCSILRLEIAHAFGVPDRWDVTGPGPHSQIDWARDAWLRRFRPALETGAMTFLAACDFESAVLAEVDAGRLSGACAQRAIGCARWLALGRERTPALRQNLSRLRREHGIAWSPRGQSPSLIDLSTVAEAVSTNPRVWCP